MRDLSPVGTANNYPRNLGSRFRLAGPAHLSGLECIHPRRRIVTHYGSLSRADNLIARKPFSSSEEKIAVLQQIIRMVKLGAIVLALAAPFTCQTAVAQGPCQQIKSACMNAGFVQGGVSAGNGLWLDCIDPIMQGTAQRHKATKPLPQVDPKLVAACKAQDASFGQPKAPSDTGTQPAPAAAVQNAAPVAPASSSKHPNIVFILTDDLAMNLF